MIDLEKTMVSDCRTFHLNKLNKPLYKSRFDEVLSFHNVEGVWLAAAQLGRIAFHINVDGVPIYAQQFFRCFGFYQGFAAVVDRDGWHHIKSDGSELYEDRYQFAGNYQENAVVVMDAEGNYFHIDENGKPLYDARWRYCGDFKDGIAVVQSQDGLNTHILKDGSFLHGRWFTDLDVYHKGFARAKTQNGWSHIDRAGSPIYSHYFLSVEPFYNGFARCEASDGALLVIDECGNVVRKLRDGHADKFAELSEDMVGYWKTMTISCAVRLQIFEHMPASLEQLARHCSCELANLSRMMSALKELDLVFFQNGLFDITEKGSYLSSTNPKTLADAAVEYAGDLLKRWENLPVLIQSGASPSGIFDAVANDRKRVRSHHRMLTSYALKDYSKIVANLPIQSGNVVFDAGGGLGTLADLVQCSFPDAIVYLGDMHEVIAESGFARKLALDFFSVWPIKADQIILARVLHDWPDKDAIEILKNAQHSLTANGNIIVVEMLLEKNSTAGALCDLHLLAVTGGKERNVEEFEELGKLAGLRLDRLVKTKSLVSFLIFHSMSIDG